ncbi:helix-turn-helix domain-containing protein [Oxalobacteraceae bacterium R-40]|uniref:Helix-turn-helix domain-containing protein n=2 Tax=Keguizhuia sedimenti TaxID=3064264 RepID=A0ABU1BM20_9BURK|nr:helix-turn-helix domain-containing protein [Oxalobacteraceae bacterium R-40]
MFAESRIAPSVTINQPVAGRQRAGHLWSSLTDVCSLLQVTPIAAASTADDVVFQHVQFKTGQRLFTVGQPFDALYILNSGFLKTVMLDEAGNEQVLSFPMKGDVLGVDGIHAKQYMSEAVALSSCDVIVIPFKVFSSLGRKYPELELSLYGVMSRELAREQSMAGMLGSLSAEARVGRFLVALSERYAAMGYSGKEFNLRMTRQEIGSYLGLTLETVSRTLSAFDRIGYIAVEGRSIILKDMPTLKTLRRLPPSQSRSKEVVAVKKSAADVSFDAAEDLLAA